jgi:hypothetical protein
MTSFDTVSTENLNKPSYEEIRDFAIRLKIRFGRKAASTADYMAKEHEQAGDFCRAEMWRAVFSSLKANEAAHSVDADMVNRLH